METSWVRNRSGCGLDPRCLYSCLALGLLGWTPAGAADSASRWEKDIQAFEAADRTQPPPANGIFFYGSSSIRLWKTLAEDFDRLPVINRGFGGCQVADCVAFVDRVVTPHRPRQIVLYAGDNDLAAARTPAQIEADFREFVRRVHHRLPQCWITFIAIKPSPARKALLDQARVANKRVREVTRTHPRLSFIDIFTPMLGEDGQPRSEFFVADQLHLNADGYRLWTRLTRPYLKTERP